MEDSAVWKALADDTRRQMLDSLKTRPFTTGELCEEFPNLDRCTIMKHICVLENSKLITFRRQGRHRLNFLNPVQLQQIHMRWLTRYTASSADRLMDLKELAERDAPAMPIEKSTTFEVRAVKYAFEIDIKAPPEKVWNLMTHDIATWWPQHFHSSEETKQFTMEPKVGGRIYEDQGNDNGVLWGIVLQFDAPRRLQFKGSLFPDYGGPGDYHLSIKVEPTDEGCRLLVDDALCGYITDENAESLETGWKELFGEHLKKAAEA